MTILPAIDLKDGNCVRLYKGEMDQATVFNNDPAAQAKAFEDAGCEWLHLVDLNGAFAGEPVNAAPVEAILKTVNHLFLRENTLPWSYLPRLEKTRRELSTLMT